MGCLNSDFVIHKIVILILSSVSVFCTVFHCSADDRILLDAKINGKRARLVFDSGSEDFILWRQTVKRLGIKFTAPITNMTLTSGEVPSGFTEPCALWLEGMEGTTRFRVINIPDYIYTNADSYDGVVGWWNLMGNILQVDANRMSLTPLAKIPKKIKGWTQFQIDTNSSILKLEMPSREDPDGYAFIDTGSDFGVEIPEKQWQEWKEKNPNQPTTFATFFGADSKFVAEEEVLAGQYSIGPLVLTNVPIMEATSPQAEDAHYEGTLGLVALRGFDLIMDGPNNAAYLRPQKRHSSNYQYNRLGAAFVQDLQGDKLIARVADNSPAQEAGIQNGDVLSDIDGFDVWTQYAKALKQLFMPAGTKIALTLMRNGKVFKTTATLREILGPQSKRTLK